MTAHPDYRSGYSYGDRFDAEIRAGADEGLRTAAIAARIGTSRPFVRDRAAKLGLAKVLERADHPDWASRQAKRALALLNPVQRANTPSKMLARIVPQVHDEGPSRLVRAMRQRLFVLDRDGLDPSHGVACLHLAGLTLPEIERLTGVPAPAVIAAVRAHCAPLGRVEL